MTIVRSLTVLAVSTFLVAGCSNTGTHIATDLGATDLTVADLASPPDLTVLPDLTELPDLTPPPDLVPPGPFCRGTTVAGTCAATFFASVSECFQPFGACTLDQPMGQTQGVLCWASGSRLQATYDQNTNVTHGVWSAGLKECLTGDVAVVGGSPTFTVSRNGQTLVYNEGTGDTTCPDGSKINIGAKEGGCQALLDILEPNTKSCMMGKCP